MNPDPNLDLTIERIIRAPRKAVWIAWTTPESLAQWWLPAPLQCRVERLEPHPGGAFVTKMSEDGETYVPHLNACFLLADEYERLVFTNALTSDWRPATPTPVAITAEITLTDHEKGTTYKAQVRHADPNAKQHHEDLGFTKGWGTVATQLATFVE